MENPENFDWVKARFECSLRQVFLHLAEVIDSDVKTVMSLPHRNEVFTLNRPSDDKIMVVKAWDADGVPQAESIVFELTNIGISVKVTGPRARQLFLAKPSLIPSGKCMLQIDGEPEPLELWQVSRRALEDLFFSRRP